MSKAKELARELLMNVGMLTEVEYKTLGLELIKAVLSEPEPNALKGFVEIEYRNPAPLLKIPNQELVLQEIINQKDQRIAELEAELASLKDPYRIFTEWQKDQIRKLEVIKQQSATDFEEGEG